MAIELEPWCHCEIKHRVLKTVFIRGITVFIERHRVGQPPVVVIVVSQGLIQIRLIIDVEVPRQIGLRSTDMCIVVRAHEGALDISEERW